MTVFRVVRVVSRPFGVLMDRPHAKCSLWDTFFWWNSNQGAPAQDLVGRVAGYAVAHDQDGDSDIHKPSTALGKRPASALSRPVRRFQVR